MNKILNIAIGLLFVLGLGILFYPTISDQYNRMHSSKAVATYQEDVGNVTGEVYDQMLADARQYNQELTSHQGTEGANSHPVTYEDCLNVRNGMMGFIEIDKIDVSLPIYHGTTENVLQKAVGHLDWTSLPTGDMGNHTVLTGHTGLPSAELFTDVDQLVYGDGFKLHILDETFHYEVTNITVVEPHEVNSLSRVFDKELVTLVTCTPYGINSHRLLVQGERRYQANEVESWEMLGGGTDVVAVGFRVVMIGLVVAIVVVVVRERRRYD